MKYFAVKFFCLFSLIPASMVLTACACGPCPDGSDGWFDVEDRQMQVTQEAKVRCHKEAPSAREACERREMKAAQEKFQKSMEEWNKCMEEVL